MSSTENPGVESMVERVARAIEGVIDRVPMVDASPSRIRAIRAEWIARAAIGAMRSPTEEMLQATVLVSHLGSGPPLFLGGKNEFVRADPSVWDAMLSAALVEKG